MTSPRSFPVAKTAVVFAVMTGFVLVIPVAFFFIGLTAPEVRAAMNLAGALVLAMSVATWLWARPSRFEVDGDALVVVWPLRTRRVARRDVSRVRVLDKRAAEELMGRAVRVGVGGLFGVFGLLKTDRLGWVGCYITTLEPLVLVELREGRPLLVSPSDAEGFAAALGR